PAGVAVPGIPHISPRNFFEAAPQVKSGGHFIGECLVLNKAVVLRPTDGLFVKVHSVKLAPLDTSNLCTNQRSTIFEVFRAIRSPLVELTMMTGQVLQVLGAFRATCGIAERGSHKRSVEMILRYFQA